VSAAALLFFRIISRPRAFVNTFALRQARKKTKKASIGTERFEKTTQNLSVVVKDLTKQCKIFQ